MTNDAPPLPLIILFPIAFVGMWLGVGALLSEIGGWARLARAFPGGPRPAGPRLSGQVIGMGMTSESNVTHVIPTDEGLYLYSTPLFRFHRPPILVPWAAVRYEGEGGALWWRSANLDLGGITTLRLRPKAMPALMPYLSRPVGRPRPDATLKLPRDRH